MTIKSIFFLLVLACLAGSCSKEPIMEADNNDTSYTEGEKIKLMIAVKDLDMRVISRSALEEAAEKEITSLAIFIIDNTTDKVVNINTHINVYDHVCDINGALLHTNLSPDGGNYIPVETLAGDNRDIYVIANYHAGAFENLKAVASKKDIEEMVVESYGNPLLREYGLGKTGLLTNQKVRKTSIITVPLSYITAKITTTVIDESADFEVIGWGLSELPLKSYVMPRAFNANDLNAHDAVDITKENDFMHEFEEQNLPFEQVEPNGGNPKYTNVFYMYENRRGNRITRNPPPGEQRQGYQEKAWYAPIHATSINIYGRWNDNGTPRIVTIAHYLGANNYDDYNIKRGNHYKYTITIKSLSNIKVDTNVEMKESNLYVYPPADLLNLDAHYNYRAIPINTFEVTDPEARISVEVLNAVNSDIASPWLNLAIFPTFIHQVRDGSNAETNTWLQTGNGEWTFVRPKFIPGKAMREQLPGYVAPNGQPIVPDDDRVLPYYDATNMHRLAKKFIDLPTKGTMPALDAPISVILYADEYPYIDESPAPAYREGVVRITLERPGKAPEYTHFNVRQYPPYLFVKVPNSTANGYDVLLVEREEEYSKLMRPGLAMNLQMISGMQWGSWDIPNANNATNGYENTLLGVYNNTTDRDNYRTPKYGSGEGAWDYSNLGEIKEGMAATFAGQLQGQPYFNLPLDSYKNSVNIDFNTTAARYCHEKNWDTNGDGVLSDNEVHWYLPSPQELQLMYTYREALKLRPDYYWTSQQASPTHAWALSMEHAQADPQQVHNGTLQQMKKAIGSTENPPHVRCVRRVPATSVTRNIPLAPLVIHNATASIIDCSPLPGSMYTTQSKMNISSGNIAARQKANLTVYKRFEVQRTQNEAQNYFDLYNGATACNQQQGWRIPTQRELLLIWSVKTELEADARFAKFSEVVGNDSNYWTMTTDLSYQYVVNFVTGFSIHNNYAGNSANKFRYRCIRELN